jgi:hypothetical protein
VNFHVLSVLRDCVQFDRLGRPTDVSEQVGETSDSIRGARKQQTKLQTKNC